MNTQTEIILAPVAGYERLVAMVLDGLTSDHSKRAYEKGLTDFLFWWVGEGKPALSKAVVQRYKAVLQAEGLASSTVNLRLSAVRKLVSEAADNGLLDPVLASGIARVKGVKAAGVRVGNWLSKEQAQALINAPDTSRLKGLRDRAILAVAVGGGLRRSEIAALAFSHLQQREARWVIVDIRGKGGRIRTVPVPAWTKAAIDEWARAAGVSSGKVFRPVHKGGWLAGDRITPQTVHDVIAEYAGALGLNVAPHDLRRTFAKLSHKGGAALEQIQLSLGHATVTTTERYLGLSQDLSAAPCDFLGLRLG